MCSKASEKAALWSFEPVSRVPGKPREDILMVV